MQICISPYTGAHAGHPIYRIGGKSQPSLILEHAGSAEYHLLSEHIVAVYRDTYGADIKVTYPLLMGLVNAKDRPLAVLGMRYATEHSPLFLERYLDQPVELHLQMVTGQSISRLTIAEVGNLASVGKSNILMLLYGLACHLEQEDMSHILFTSTSLLKRYLNSLGLYPHILAEANPAKLGTDAARWGNYYDTRPTVMAGSVREFRLGLEGYFRKQAMQ